MNENKTETLFRLFKFSRLLYHHGISGWVTLPPDANN